MNSLVFPDSRPHINQDLHTTLATGKQSLMDIAWEQHRFHEYRRWSPLELIEKVDLAAITPAERVNILNAGRSELSAKPGADRLTRQAQAEYLCWKDANPDVAHIMQACASWVRYWNVEESIHEVVFTKLAAAVGMVPITNDTYVTFRQAFPDDDMLRTLTMLALTEIAAFVGYSTYAKTATEANLAAIYRNAAADESQHMTYFLAFAKALVDSGAYHPKQAFATCHFFLREGGEFEASSRPRTEARNGHVNWWDEFTPVEGDLLLLENAQRKEQLVYAALHKITGISVSNPTELEDTWQALVEASLA